MKTLTTARQAAAVLLGIDLQGTIGVNLSQTDYFRLESAMADVIAAVPGDYAPDVVAWAQKHITGPNYRRGPETLSFREAAGIFAGEFVAQGQALNPLSEQNRTTTRNTIIAVCLIGAAAFFAVVATRAKQTLSA